MNGYEVLFVGGDWDGQVRMLPEAVDHRGLGQGRPVYVVEIKAAPPFVAREGYPQATGSDPVERMLFVYDVKVNPSDDGPLWIAVPRDSGWKAPFDPRTDDPRDRTPVTYEDFLQETFMNRPPRDPKRRP